MKSEHLFIEKAKVRKLWDCILFDRYHEKSKLFKNNFNFG